MTDGIDTEPTVTALIGTDTERTKRRGGGTCVGIAATE